MPTITSTTLSTGRCTTSEPFSGLMNSPPRATAVLTNTQVPVLRTIHHRRKIARTANWLTFRSATTKNSLLAARKSSIRFKSRTRNSRQTQKKYVTLVTSSPMSFKPCTLRRIKIRSNQSKTQLAVSCLSAPSPVLPTVLMTRWKSPLSITFFFSRKALTSTLRI